MNSSLRIEKRKVENKRKVDQKKMEKKNGERTVEKKNHFVGIVKNPSLFQALHAWFTSKKDMTTRLK